MSRAIEDSAHAGLMRVLGDEALVSAEELSRAVTAADRVNGRLDHALLELGLITLAQLHDVGLRHLGFERFEDHQLAPHNLPHRFIAHKLVVPLRSPDGQAALGMVDPFDDLAYFAVRLRASFIGKRVILTPEEFGTLTVAGDPPSAVDVDFTVPETVPDADDLAALREVGSTEPVIRFMRMLIASAVRQGASDIHLRAGPKSASALLRIDGELSELVAPSKDLLSELVSRLKLLARLDISERRLPQDGRLRLSAGGAQVDFRLSTMPHLYGEGAVLRILSKDASSLSLEGLGFEPGVVDALAEVCTWGHGLFLVAGPTGSGKTTTLYALLNRLRRPEINIVSVEDPVEYRFEGIAQIQVDERVGLTFPVALRSLLRQDPDVILLGEIRDPQTAQIAAQAALTGHLVLASIHADSAQKCVPRLIDMGVPSYLVDAVLRGAVAQQLVPSMCPSCSPPNQEACPACGGTGRLGRHPVAEILLFEPSEADVVDVYPSQPGGRASVRARGATA